MRRIAWLFALALFSALSAGSAAAQRTDEITGKLVRVTAPNFADHVVTGTVTSYAQEGITVTEDSTGQVHLFPLRAVQRLDIYRGEGGTASAPRRAKLYGFIGLALGAIAGPIIALNTDRDVLTTTAMTGGAGLLGGAAIGALSGASHPTAQWTWNIHPWGYDASLRPAQP